MEAAPAAPRSLLVASDLSSRCDRALDRAVLLARQWQARLVVVTVLEREPGGRSREETAELRDRARRLLLADLGDQGVPFELHVERGGIVGALLKHAPACDLVVTGTARAHGLGRLVLGSTVDALARRSPVPVLVVRQRGRHPYPQLIVGSDWSAASERALRHACAWWPATPTTLFHGHGAAVAARTGVDLAVARDAAGEQAERDARRFVAQVLPPERSPRRLAQWLEAGDPGLVLQQHGRQRPEDLVVLGTEGRSGLVGLLLGSVAERILDMVDNDVLLVRPPPT